MNLNKEQTQAISHFKGPALVLAVPGAGKTTVLIHRTANLILNKNISPENILSLTFSKSSAKNMKERFNNLYGDISHIPVHFSTIHSFAYNLIKEYAYKNGIEFNLIENNKNKLNKYNILKDIYYSKNNDYITEEKLDTLLNSIGYIKNMLITPKDFLAKNTINIKNFQEIFNTYEQYKKRNNLIDFDDMLTLSLEIFKKDRYLLNKYRNKYSYIQVDEGQDTSKAQMEIIKILSYPQNNFFIVADDDQSIYGFRGAYPKGLFEFNKSYKDIKLFYMEQNYRSSKNIVSVSNKFIKQNNSRYNKDIFTNNLFVEPINIIKLKTSEDQYQHIIDEIIEKKDYNNSAILYRNNLSAVGIIEYLEKNKIPFHMKDIRINFFSHWVVQDLFSFLSLAQEPSNVKFLEDIFFKMKGFISKKQINYIKTLDHKIPVFDRLLQLPGINRFYKKNFRELKLDFKKISKMNPYEGIQYIDKELNYGYYLKESCMKFGHTLNALQTILYFLQMIAFETKDLNELISRIKYLQYLTFQSKNVVNGVNLSTIHSAKGLEFKNVYIIDLIEGDFPNSDSIDDYENGNIETLEEERRLFYVGMTRAKEHLSLITTKNKNSSPVDPSRFLTELESLIDRG